MNRKNIKHSEHMKDYSFNILGCALYNAAFSERGRPFSNTISVINAAHGAEIFIKAKIAEEHVLLIFEKYPPQNNIEDGLNLDILFESGVTYSYSKLPYILQIVTGYKMKNQDKYLEFGRLRNGLIHFTAVKENTSEITLKYLFELCDPVIWDFWDDSFLETALYWNDGYLAEEGILKEILDEYNLTLQPMTIKYLNNLKI